jgi:predicted O-methyltransferase YrrM
MIINPISDVPCEPTAVTATTANATNADHALSPNGLLDYIRQYGMTETSEQYQLRMISADHRIGERMMTPPEQAHLIAWLIRLCNARDILEIGVFTGYTTLTMALALPADGRIVALDRSENTSEIAKVFWQAAGVAHKIDLRLGRALDTLPILHAEYGQHAFDFIYLDADKRNYPQYIEHAYSLLRPNGLLAVDNTLFDGLVIAPQGHRFAEVIHALNQTLQNDDRFDLCLLPIGDGLTLLRKIK